jgi:hypothetical protein
VQHVIAEQADQDVVPTFPLQNVRIVQALVDGALRLDDRVVHIVVITADQDVRAALAFDECGLKQLQGANPGAEQDAHQERAQDRERVSASTSSHQEPFPVRFHRHGSSSSGRDGIWGYQSCCFMTRASGPEIKRPVPPHREG